MEFNRKDTLIVKGVAVILMVIHHLFAFPDRLNGVTYISIATINGQTIEYILGHFGKICVAIFTFMAGFGLYKKNSLNKITVKDMFCIIKKLYINYWIILFFFVGVSVIIGYRKIEFAEFIDNILGYNYTYNREAWYIWLYVMLVITFPISLKIINKDLWSSLFKLAIISIIIRTIIPSVFSWDMLKLLKKTIYYNNIHLLRWYLCFLSGIIFAKYNLFEKINFSIRNNIIEYVVLSFLSLCFRKRYGSFFDFIFVPMFVICIVNVIKIMKIDNIFEYFGKHSTNIWLIHSFFVYQYFQKITYMPNISILILVWTLILTLISSNFIMFIQKKLKVVRL